MSPTTSLPQKEYKRAGENVEQNPNLEYIMNALGGVKDEEAVQMAILLELARTNVILRRIELTLDQIEIGTRRIK